MAAFSEEKKLEVSGIFLTSLALFPVLRPAVQSILIILFAVVCVGLYYQNFLRNIKNKKAVYAFLILTSFYLWHALTILWSDDRLAGIEALQSSMVLVLFPFLFVFFHPRPTQKTVLRIQWVFLGAMLLMSLLWFHSYLEGVSYYQELKLKEVPVRELPFLDQVRFFFQKGYYWVSGSSIRGYRLAKEETNLFLHHGYLCAFFLMAFLFCIRLFGKYKSIGIRLLLSIVGCLFLIFILYLPSAINKLALLITTPIVLYYFAAKKAAIFVVLLGLIALVATAIFYGDNINRIKMVEKENVLSKKPVVIDFFRYHTYKCVFKEAPSHIIVGMGVGDVQNYLNDCTPEKDWPGLSEERRLINTHSQFLHYQLAGGFIGLGLFLLLWFKLFAWTFVKREPLVLVILLIVFFNTMFENFLSRIWGAFFFGYFVFSFLSLPFVDNPTEVEQ